ncbi:hypothetical protein [Actinomadura rugatobispora]|uniref:Uncharacterized protein n=1 Tax=Actinomadura rugatobispora TaxID=1994 RepID=A0ABW1A6R7_9ACTN|nr:hypothetical protein GCM10010200_078800 [Actinomadura rugatobispora]
MARTVADVALLLEVMAGPDGVDQRRWQEPERPGVHVSIPEHRLAAAILPASMLIGTTHQLLYGDGAGLNHRGPADLPLMRAVLDGRRSRAAALSPGITMALLGGGYLLAQDGGMGYAMARQAAPWLRAGYDRALARHDLLAMPRASGDLGSGRARRRAAEGPDAGRRARRRRGRAPRGERLGGAHRRLPAARRGAPRQVTRQVMAPPEDRIDTDAKERP